MPLKRSWAHLSQSWPFYLIILCILFFSTNFQERFDLPIWDEPSYSKGHFRGSHGWAPIYQLVYLFLNDFTPNRPISFYTNLFFQSFLLLPLVFMLILRKLHLSRPAVFTGGFLILTAPWNFLLSPKVQSFNLIFLLVALAVRIHMQKKRLVQYPFFYALLTVSLFIRQDNLILLLISLLFDLGHAREDQVARIKKYALIFFTVIITFWSTYHLLGRTLPSHPRRTLYAFLDHHFWSHHKRNEFNFFSHVPRHEWGKKVFDDPENLEQVIVEHPGKFIDHLHLNILQLPRLIYTAMSSRISYDHFFFNSWVNLFWINTIIFIIFIFTSERKRNEQFVIRSVLVFALGLGIKSLTISLILAPWPQYLLDFFLCLFLLFPLLPLRISPRNKTISIFLILVLVCSLYGHNYRNSSLQAVRGRPDNGFTFYTYLNRLITSGKFKKALAGNGITTWLDRFETVFVGHSCIGQENKLNLKECLRNSGIDLIIYDIDFQNRLQFHPARREFAAMFIRPEDFEFTKIYSLHSDFGDDWAVYARGDQHDSTDDINEKSVRNKAGHSRSE